MAQYISCGQALYSSSKDGFRVYIQGSAGRVSSWWMNALHQRFQTSAHTHTHTRTDTRTHTRKNIHTHAQAHTCTRKHEHVRTHAQIRMDEEDGPGTKGCACARSMRKAACFTCVVRALAVRCLYACSCECMHHKGILC